jgi:transposase-like protein
MGGINMPYKEVSLNTKIDVVKDYFSGMKVAQIARKHKVSRDSVYTWKDTALDSMKQALKPYQTNKVDELENELKNLKEKHQKLSKKYKLLTQKKRLSVATTPSQEIRPTQCPVCSGNNIIKNGGYETKNGYKQRFRCKDCNRRIFVVKKNCN